MQQRRFAGLPRLFGDQSAQAIFNAHVAVVGIGGVGSWAAEALARSGVGTITLVDMDHVAQSNINRQVHATEQSLGMAKVDAMRERIALINPDCQVHCVDAFVEPDLWPAMLPSPVDAVLDACDQVRAKITIAHWALQSRTLCVTVGAAGGKRMAQQVEVADLSLVSHDPLLAKLRYQLRKSHGAAAGGKKMHVTCVFSREPMQAADASCEVQTDGSLNCHGYGSLVTVTATFGMSAAGWIVNEIAKRTN